MLIERFWHLRHSTYEKRKIDKIIAKSSIVVFDLHPSIFSAVLLYPFPHH